MKSKAFAVIGLGFGDEGKGATVDYLCRIHKISCIIRFNGGPQAAHHVVLPNKIWHCFSQFGSGSFVSGVKTHLSAEVLIEPSNLLREAEVLTQKGVNKPLSGISFDPNCRIITPWNKMIGQLTEMQRNHNRHSSVGMGVGDTILDSGFGDKYVLKVKDLCGNDELLKNKIKFISDYKFRQAHQILKDNSDTEMIKIVHYYTSYSVQKIFSYLIQFYFIIKGNIIDDDILLNNLVKRKENFVFEGAQGTLLDKRFGFKPYITKTYTTSDVVEKLVEPFADELDINFIGVIRSYFHRHGNGPLVTEDETLTSILTEEHNQYNQWQGKFRCGWFDMPLFKYALAKNNIDQIYMTNLDRLADQKKIKVCIDYKYNAQSILSIPEKITTEELFRYKTGNCIEFNSWSNNHNDPNLRKFIQFFNDILEIKISNIALGTTYLDKNDVSARFAE